MSPSQHLKRESEGRTMRPVHFLFAARWVANFIGKLRARITRDQKKSEGRPGGGKEEVNTLAMVRAES
jgi:hypothetical protein